MAAHDPYFQFPLVALAFGADPVQRLRHVVDWCLVDVGSEQAAAMTMPELKAVFSEMPDESRPGGVRLTDREHLAVIKGMRMLHVRGGSVTATIEHHEAVERFLRTMAAKDGPSPLVRVKTELVWDCIHGAMPYRSFSVLAAVYCMIGRKEWPVRITRDRIQAAAMGYKSPKLMTGETLEARQDKAEPLSIDQLRYTLNQLEGDNHFVRVQLSPRRVYFSNRLTREEMEERLFKTATKRGARLTKYRAADQNLQARIRKAIIVGKPPERSPRIPREVPVESPPIPHEVPTIIETTLTESSLTETLFKETCVIQAAQPPMGVVASPESESKRQRIERLLRLAEELGTAEAMKQASRYRAQLEALTKP